MNDAPQQTGDASGEPLAGERLAEARKLRQISLPDIARELHLDEAKVQALEENRFDVLGAPVFAKGHLRKYADLVGVPIEDVLADYYQMSRGTGAPPVVLAPRERPARDINLGPWLLGIPLLLIVAGAVYWWLGRPLPTADTGDAPEPVPQSESAAPPGEDTAQPLANQPAGNEAAAGDETPEPEATSAPAPDADDPPPAAAGQVAEPVAQAAPVADNAAPSRSAPAAGRVVALRLTYSGECWTEITAADGERLYFDLGRSGQTLNVSGEVPIRVLLGDSNNVALSVDGQPYSIAAADRRGETARFVIGR